MSYKCLVITKVQSKVFSVAIHRVRSCLISDLYYIIIIFQSDICESVVLQ